MQCATAVCIADWCGIKPGIRDSCYLLHVEAIKVWAMAGIQVEAVSKRVEQHFCTHANSQ